MVDKAAANKAKNAGNIAFKAKDFDTAITSYNTAIELDPDEVILCFNVLTKMMQWMFSFIIIIIIFTHKSYNYVFKIQL